MRFSQVRCVFDYEFILKFIIKFVWKWTYTGFNNKGNFGFLIKQSPEVGRCAGLLWFNISTVSSRMDPVSFCLCVNFSVSLAPPQVHRSEKEGLWCSAYRVRGSWPLAALSKPSFSSATCDGVPIIHHDHGMFFHLFRSSLISFHNVS